MTKEEAIKFLANTKVYVNGKSKEIQEKLFSLGYTWPINEVRVEYAYKPFLYINNDKRLNYGDNMEYFSNSENREVTAEEILSLELTEPKYRPFTSPVECFEEMSRHLPVGWVKRKHIYGDYILLGHICTSYNFADCFKKYTFADGTPFGIKEG